MRQIASRKIFQQFLDTNFFMFAAELRRPEGLLSGAPYLERKAKETHELIFSWLMQNDVQIIIMFTPSANFNQLLVGLGFNQSESNKERLECNN